MAVEKNVAIVLVNLGTPSAPDASAVRVFLKEFLSDARVIEGRGPRRWLWLAILNLIILRVRPKKVAKLYRGIWQSDSPMRLILQRQVEALELLLQNKFSKKVNVYSAMTYGKDNLEHRLAALATAGIERVLVIPLYPQYSATSTAPVYDKVAKFQQRSRNVLDVRIVKSYYDHPSFISALAASVEQHWSEYGMADRLLLSYHGIPQQYADKGDPYPLQCKATTQELMDKLAPQDEGFFISSFQSRFGPTQWVQPYTEQTLIELAQQGVKRLDVICPAFSADCLETLEEIAITNKEVFIAAGGEEYRYITAVNDSPEFIGCLSDIVNVQAADWLGE